MNIQQQLPRLAVSTILIVLATACSSSKTPQVTPASPTPSANTQVTPASPTPSADSQLPIDPTAQVNKVRSKIKSAQDEDAKRREQLP